MANVLKNGTPVFTKDGKAMYARDVVDENGNPDSSGQYVSDTRKFTVKGFIGISTGIVLGNWLKVVIIYKHTTDASGTFTSTGTYWVSTNLITSVGKIDKNVENYVRVYEGMQGKENRDYANNDNVPNKDKNGTEGGTGGNGDGAFGAGLLNISLGGKWLIAAFVAGVLLAKNKKK